MDYLARIHRLQNRLSTIPCDALLIDDAINLYYLTGLELSAGKLLVTKSQATLIVDARYFELCKKSSPFPVVLLENHTLETLLNSQNPQIKQLAFNQTTTSYQNYKQLQTTIHTAQSHRDDHLSIELIPTDEPISLRQIKDADEIQALKTSATLGSEGFDFVCSILKEGITEKQVALELEIFWKKRGSKGLAFDPIIAFGPNSSMPHYRAGDKPLKKGDIVLIDIGVNYEHYHSDMTRTLFFGDPDPKLVEIYHIVQQAQAAAMAQCRPGITLGALDHTARQIIADGGYDQQFTHSLGHGIGLEVHEPPTVKNKQPFDHIPLVEGMAITIEPGIYLPEIGGVRIEDTVVITKTGYESLTNRSTELQVIR